ncbi:unnamed protein product [Rangifer tarandus platyrhynchus]|uniref:Uncharacterized protein n=2 Tax=Rangifer tarandus platyrhynchus TaxID=3082113 RepID=A0ABN8Y6X6_RANTA|nr:unnamed protein product [Rangifer tarandus platyrhynchus]
MICGLGTSQNHTPGQGLFQRNTREALTSSSEDSPRLLGFLELVVPILSSSFSSSQAAYDPFLSPNFLFKSRWKLILHFHQRVILKVFIYTPVIKMQYYKLLLARLLNSVCFLLVKPSTFLLFILPTTVALAVFKFFLICIFIVLCLHRL